MKNSDYIKQFERNYILVPTQRAAGLLMELLPMSAEPCCKNMAPKVSWLMVLLPISPHLTLPCVGKCDILPHTPHLELPHMAPAQHSANPTGKLDRAHLAAQPS